MVEQKDAVAELTDAEAELYDRQIRLWGLDSQKRLRSAKVLLVGMNGFAAEVAKNVILAGVKSITFLDHRNLTAEDMCSQFLAPKTEIGKNRAEASVQRAQNLNPMVIVNADTTKVDNKPDSYFANFDVVCVSECTITQTRRINNACRKHNVKFFVGDVWGMFGYTFADLDTHEFAEDVVQSRKVQSGAGEPLGKDVYQNVVTTVKRKETFVPFEQIFEVEKVPKDGDTYYLLRIMLNYREKYGKDPLPSERDCKGLKDEIASIIEEYELGDTINYLTEGDVYGQTSPVCSIVGGVMGQEIIKTVSQKEAPHNNIFIFNPQTMCGKILHLGYA
ncbi:SUMO-activating enzyme subunit 1 [Orussus abietinus]|uniref:SUMO-activating enzyme subunit 1 n=1 Tax=Orussus abietinus TaxID=222816 RepID=UPI0006267530|nr:SUMO-activating enzyme subunit 1 [Orussus abietinus]